MSFSELLGRLVTKGAYPKRGSVKVRWGQLLRASPILTAEESRLVAADQLATLDSFGTIRGGVVTRANAYFLVRELPFDQIPSRLRVTRGDLGRIAVVEDGLDHVTKIEREFLKPVIKGPESLESAFGIKRSQLRLFDVKDDKKALAGRDASGALAFLRRGETVNYKVSEDDLKGGVPARRSQVKNRKPFWYSLQGEQIPQPRIVFPEHVDRRYVFTLVGGGDDSVVIDKLYLFEPDDAEEIGLIHASLNSVYTWYQMELRGRSQLGEGVLELKIPDFAGLLILNPGKVRRKQRQDLLALFANLANPGALASLSELGTAARLAFDRAYLKLCGFEDPETMVVRVEQALRALAGERNERRLSVADAKVSRRRITNVAASIDAYATRIAASIDPHPDPRTFVEEGSPMEIVPILAELAGELEIGVELFNQGEVLTGGVCVARAGNMTAAQFVRGVLMLEPELSQVEVPTGTVLDRAVEDFTRESRRWHKTFGMVVNRTLIGVDDARTRATIEQRALRLLHAL